MRSTLRLLLVALASCRDDGPAVDDATGETSAAGQTSTTGSTTSDDDDDDAPASSSAGDDSSSATASIATSTDDSASTSDTDPGSLDDNGCPLTAPRSWIACESFDAITDAPTQLSQWNVAGDGFAVEAGGVSGGQALRVRLQPGIMFGGWVTLRFGQGPDAPSIDSPDGRWDELWLRYRLRTGDDWPGRQIGDVGEMIAMNGANWAIAADLNIQGDAGLRVRPIGWSCIVAGELGCDGTNDWSGALQPIWDAFGTTQVFDAAHAGTWQCFEAHMRLDDPGAANGEAHIWVDGVAEIEQGGLAWRETWDDFGINAVRFTNYADPVDAPLDFFVDDVVVATERIGCD